MRLDFGDDVGIGFSLFGQQHQWSTGRKLREDIHRKTDHSQVVVQEFFTRCVIWGVAGNPYGLTYLSENRINPRQRVTGDIGECGSLTLGDRLLNFCQVEARQLIGPRALAPRRMRLIMPE